jgi:hypothetical protein
MTNYGSQPSADIRKYIWDNIQSAEILDENDYYVDGMQDSIVPIVPAQQIPEFNNSLPGRTYMLYDFDLKQIPVQWWMSEESFTLTVISQNYEIINQITSLTQDLFRRYDESAVDLNEYLDGNTDFLYHHIMIDSVFSPEPFGTEGDYQVGSVVFSYNYSRKTDPKGRF